VRSLGGKRKTNAALEPCPGAATELPSPLRFLHSPLPTCTCLSDKLSNSYVGLTLDLSTKFIGRNQANLWKACHIVISAHGDKLWRTQVFFWTNFAIAELHDLLDLQEETNSSRIGNFKDNS
jgi:hypothetical protein